MMTYRSELSSREDELLAAKEKVAHLNEVRGQNEKYLVISQSKLNNLKQSNEQLRRKLNSLKKEEERLSKKCTKEGEYLQTKLSFYEKKWRDRYEVYCAKNPKMRERENAIQEIKRLKEKLSAVDRELQKHEKDLFRAKCARNGRTSDEMKMCPFSVFLVKVAQIYVDTKKVLAECNKTAQEIADRERDIQIQKLKRQLCHSKLANSCMMSEDDAANSFNQSGSLALDSSGYGPVPLNANIEHNISEQYFENDLAEREQQMEISNDDITLKTTTTVNIGNTEENASSITNFNEVKNEGFERNRDAYVDLQKTTEHSPLVRNAEKMPTLLGSRGSTTDSSKKASKDKKVRSWLDKLKIFVPNFTKKTESVKPCDVEAEMRNFEEKEHTRETTENTPGRDVLDVDRRSAVIQTEHRIPGIKNTSKYFPRDNSDTHMDWEVTEVNEITKPSGAENKEIVVLGKNVKDRDNSAQKMAEANSEETREHLDKEDKNEEPKGQDHLSKAENLPVEIEREVYSTLHASETDEKGAKSPANGLAFVNEIQSTSLKDDDNDYRIKLGNLKVDNELSGVEQTASKETPHIECLEATVKDLTSAETNAEEDQKLIMFQGQESDSKSDRSPETDKLDRVSTSPMTDVTINSPYPLFGTLQSVDQMQKCSGSNPKSPTAPNPEENPRQGDEEMPDSISLFKPESMSPGFAYTTRLMYENVAGPSSKQVGDMFAQLSFFGKSPSGQNSTQVEDDKNEFLLASAFEDYLSDSPPTAKRTEKSMFTFTEESPEGKNDFFPLFAADNGESSKDSKTTGGGGQFVFNFGGSEKSPEEATGFTFMF